MPGAVDKHIGLALAARLRGSRRSVAHRPAGARLPGWTDPQFIGAVPVTLWDLRDALTVLIANVIRFEVGS
jgi:hypothetical protein